MICYGFKGGSGTASRQVGFGGERYAVGAFVQANFGLREQLVIAGVPVGRALKDWEPDQRGGVEFGSVIAIVATDAPLLPHQLSRLARRASAGHRPQRRDQRPRLGRHLPGLLHRERRGAGQRATAAARRFVPDAKLDPFFAATIQAVDEAVLNSLVANETMTGADDHVVHALPHAEVRALLTKAGVG